MTTWVRQAGDTSDFAFLVSFENDPDKVSFDDPGYSGSWGAFQIWVDGVNLCVHNVAGETSESAHWYVLPLLEWLAENWDPLLHEERLPLSARFPTAAEAMTSEPPLPLGAQNQGYYDALEIWQSWSRRHALEAAADGGTFPRVFVRRWGDKVEVSWNSVALVGVPHGLRFSAPRGVRANLPQTLQRSSTPSHSRRRWSSSAGIRNLNVSVP